jgi:hypothetical protein
MTILVQWLCDLQSDYDSGLEDFEVFKKEMQEMFCKYSPKLNPAMLCITDVLQGARELA